tara:strand:- start:199 stop:570 length:372 start_codon:yes stop_codon:yes gene_type:complete
MSDFNLNSIDPFKLEQMIISRQIDERNSHQLYGEEFVWEDCVVIASGTEEDGRNDHDPDWVEIPADKDSGWEVDVIESAKKYAEEYPESEVIWLEGQMRYVVKHEEWEENEPLGIYWCIEIKV